MKSNMKKWFFLLLAVCLLSTNCCTSLAKTTLPEASAKSVSQKKFSKRAVKTMYYTPMGSLWWTKVKHAQGYKIYVCSKNGKKCKLFKTIKSGNRLYYSSKKLYYTDKCFRIRAYRKINGKIVYSDWEKEVVYFE